MGNVTSDLGWRGLIAECSDLEGVSKLPSGTACYFGIDPTAPFLHIGHLLSTLGLVRLQKAGIKPLLLFGGATGSIGDPSGRSSERSMLDRDAVSFNVEKHQATITRLWERLGIEKPKFLNNYDWTANLSTLDFLRDIGKHFTLSYMLGKDSVSSRMSGDGISYTEFSYMLLQAMDYLHLYQHENCRLQVGGSDQWGNLTAGLELIRRKGLGPAYALTFPLVTDSSGKKLGKSEGKSISLGPELTSPYVFHQYWLNLEDNVVVKLLKYFTFLEESEIQSAEEALKAKPEERAAQKLLADAVCNLVHGKSETELAKKSAKVLFGGSMDGLSYQSLSQIFSEVPSFEIPAGELIGMSVQDTFAKSGIVKSKGEAKRLISNGGAYINNERLSEADEKIKDTHLIEGKLLVLRSGKKHYCLVKVL